MHIFISYAKLDTRDLAIQVRDSLTALPDVTAWMDASLYSGEDWAVQIQDEIDRADLIVVLLSPDVNRPANHPKGRSFVLKEIHYAQQVRKTIIPVMAQTTRPPVQLAGIEYIDLTRDPSSGLQRLTRDIASRAGIPLTDIPVSAPPDNLLTNTQSPTAVGTAFLPSAPQIDPPPQFVGMRHVSHDIGIKRYTAA